MDLYKTLQHQRDMLDSIFNLLSTNTVTPEKDIWFNLDGILEYIPYSMSKPTLYEKLQTGKFPGEKRGKFWFSKKSWIDIYLETGEVYTSNKSYK